MSASSAWIILAFAGLLEVCWAIGLKYTEGFTKLGASGFTLICLALSMYLLAKASQVLGASIVGILVLKEPVSVAKVIFLGMLLVAIIGLKLSSK